MTSELLAFTEYEEEICFDLDDPDFVTTTKASSTSNTGNALRTNALTCSMEARVPSPMTLAGVRPLDVHADDSSDPTARSRSCGTVGSFGGSCGSYGSPEDVRQFPGRSEQAVISIEELRLQLNSCFTCGVCWQQEHVSLDCSECGGYSLERPCPVCEGRCDSTWKRDLTTTHASGKATWEGECGLEGGPPFARTRLLLQPLPLVPDGPNPARRADGLDS